MTLNKSFLEKIYSKYNDKKYLYSDPIYFVHKYKGKNDIEISALISSSLAYGNIRQIIKNLTNIFTKMGNSPYFFLKNHSYKEIKKLFKNFKYRFTSAKEFSDFLINIKVAYENYGNIENQFMKNYKYNDENIYRSICKFITLFSVHKTPTLLPSPNKGSAFKRFNLFLRWMVRKDNIDLGIWEKIKLSQLIVPLDTHMHKIAKEFKITQSNDTSIKTAVEITQAFNKINPDDPVKYDFALTRTKILKNDKIYYI